MESPRFEGGLGHVLAIDDEWPPEVKSSRPAIMRSKVDLPQPEGPTKTTNSPFLMSRSAPGMMTCVTKGLACFLKAEIVPMLFHRSECETAYKLFLCKPAKHKDGCYGHG